MCSLEFIIRCGSPWLKTQILYLLLETSYSLATQTKMRPAKYIMKADDDAFLGLMKLYLASREMHLMASWMVLFFPNQHPIGTRTADSTEAFI